MNGFKVEGCTIWSNIDCDAGEARIYMAVLRSTWLGEMPMTRLNALEKAASDS